MTRQFRREMQGKNGHILGKIWQCALDIFRSVHQPSKGVYMRGTVQVFVGPYLPLASKWEFLLGRQACPIHTRP